MADEEPGEPPEIEIDDPSPVRLFAERIARRELLKRGGKFFGAIGFFSTIAGITAESAFAFSPFCSDLSNPCACSGGNCYQNGQLCTPRTTDCDSSCAHPIPGGQCWSEACSPCTCTYCDWYCHGVKCRCLKVDCPGLPAGKAAEVEQQMHAAAA